MVVPAMYNSRSRHETLTLRVHLQAYPVVIEEPSPAFLKRKLCIVFPDCGIGHLLAVLCTGRGNSAWKLGNSAHYTVQQCAAVRH